jgi:hypothetical protein
MTGRVSVGTLSATYLVPADAADENAVRLRLDGVGRRLDRTLAAPLRRLAAAREGEVWLVRRLDADVELDLAADDETLARAWADGVAAALAARLGARRPAPAGGTEQVDDGIVCFADRAEQLAAFVADLAGGRAWSRWWHAEFDGLRPLPVAAAIEAALVREPEPGRTALARLSRARKLAPVAAALGARAAGRVADALYGGAAPAAGLAAAARRARELGLDGEPAALFACAAASASTPSGAAERAPAAARRAVADEGAAAAVTETGLGGAFLLLPGLVRLFADLDPAMRLLVLRSALGAARALESGADPVLAAAAGAGPDAEEPGPPAALAAALVRALLAGGRTDGAELSLAPTDHGPLVLDAATGTWLGIGEATLETVAAVTGREHRVSDVAGADLGAELASFALPGASAAVAVAGRAVLRELAHRLAGLARSSPEHLWRNVLDRPARVEAHARGLRVELGPAPLDVLLRLAGVDRDRFAVPWLGEVELALAP